MTTTRLPVLDRLRVAAPCSAAWDDMRGDDRVRFCGRCEQNVYNLSAMARDEAEALVQAQSGRMCVRFYQRADGTVMTSDCPVGTRRQRLKQRMWAAVAGATTSAALLFNLWSGRARADLAVGDGKTAATRPQPPIGQATMGEPAPPPEPAIMGGIRPTTTPPATTTPPPATTTPPKSEPKMGKVSVARPPHPLPLMGSIPAPVQGRQVAAKTPSPSKPSSDDR